MYINVISIHSIIHVLSIKEDGYVLQAQNLYFLREVQAVFVVRLYLQHFHFALDCMEHLWLTFGFSVIYDRSLLFSPGTHSVLSEGLPPNT